MEIVSDEPREVLVSDLSDDVIDKARKLASAAHEGQVDKAGQPYITHPQRVAARAIAICNDEAPQLADIAVPAAWLHDTLEDTTITVDGLRQLGFPEAVVQTVDALTKKMREPVDAYASRIVAVPAAIIVKRADLADNTDPERLGLLDHDTRQRLEAKYAAFREVLGQALSARGTVVLCDYRTPAIDIGVTAGLGDSGLMLEGQDFGPNVQRSWGDSDYEYWMRLSPIGAEQLRQHLGASDLLGRLGLDFTGPNGMRRLRDLCDGAGIAYRFTTYV